MCFHYMSIRKMFIIALFANMLEKYYHHVDGIHCRSKYSTSNFRLKSKFDQIVTLLNIFHNVSATCWCRENVTCTFLLPPHVNSYLMFSHMLTSLSIAQPIWAITDHTICLYRSYNAPSCRHRKPIWSI